MPDSSIGGDTFLAHFNQNVLAVYAFVWGQCTDIMRQKVEATKGFGKISIDQGCLELLKIIKDVVNNCQSQKKLSNALFKAKSAFYHCYHGKMTRLLSLSK